MIAGAPASSRRSSVGSRCSHERSLGPKRRLGSCLETMLFRTVIGTDVQRPSARRRHRCRLRQARRQERSSVKGDPRRSSGRSSARRDCACHGARERTARPNEGAADGLGRRRAREAAGLGDIGRRSALNKLPHLNLDCPADLPTVEITRLASATGPLTKRIRLADDGALISDGAVCLMGRGAASRLRLAGMGAFARQLETLETNQAIALGALAADLPDEVEITTQRKLAAMNGPRRPTSSPAPPATSPTAPTAGARADRHRHQGYAARGRRPDQAIGGYWAALARRAGSGARRPRRANLDQFRHLSHRHRRGSQGFERGPHLLAGAGRRRRRAVPAHAARSLLARRARLDDGRRRRPAARAIADRPDGVARRAACVRGRADHGTSRFGRTRSNARQRSSRARRPKPAASVRT